MLTYAAVAVLTAVLLWGFVNRFLPTDRAAGGPNGATVTFSPSSGPLSAGTSQKTTFTLTPNTAGKTITAFDVRLKATGNTEFISVSKPVNFSPDNELFHEVLPATIRLAYTVGVNAEPTSSVQFEITFKGKAPGVGAIEVDTTNSEIVGNVDNYVFALDTVTNPSFTYTQGGQNQAVIEFPENGQVVPKGQDLVVTVRVNVRDTGKKIAGVDLQISADGVLKMVRSSGPFSGDFNQLTPPTNVTATNARIVDIAKSDKDPSVDIYDVRMTVRSDADGQGSISVSNVTVSDIAGNAFDIGGATTGTYTFGQVATPPTSTPRPTDSPQQCDELAPAFFSKPGYSSTYSNGKVTFNPPGGKIAMYKANVPYWGPDWEALEFPVVIQSNTAKVPNGNFQADYLVADAEVLASPKFGGDTYSGRGTLLGAVNGKHCKDDDGPKPTDLPGGNPTDSPNPTNPPGGGGALSCGVSCAKDADCASGFCNPAGFPLCPTSRPGEPLEGCQLIPPDPTLPSVCAPVTCREDNTNCSCPVGGGGAGAGGTPVSVSLNMKLRLQGITKKPLRADADVFQVRLVGPSDVRLFGTFTPDNDGVYTGTITGNAIPGKYYVLVKGPRHIQKKVCVATPGESKPGTYHCAAGQIDIQAGSNVLNFSQVALLVGDLPMQDGVVDSYDFSYIRQTLGSSKASDLLVGDLNRDGIIDTQDVSLILQALAIKYDEE